MRLVEEPSKKSGTSENTLRRFIAAAQVLETHGIRELPPGVKYLPVASAEATERISKKNPERGRRLFNGLFEGSGSIRDFKAVLADMPKRASLLKTSGRVKSFSVDDIPDMIARRAHVSHRDLTSIRFIDAPLKRSSNLFAKTAAPVLVASMSYGRRAAVFDESVLAWSAGRAMITRKFLRNIAVATATFDYVLVLCTTLTSEVRDLVGEMPQVCKDRAVALSGVFDS